MVFTSPGEVAFNIFSMPVYFYGLIMAFAVFTGCMTVYFLFKIFYSREQAGIIIDYSPFIIFSGIIGARLYYCLVNLDYYIQFPLQILNIRQGGLSVHGMLFIGVCAILYTAWRKNISFWKLFDVFCCGAAIGQSIGRWGNFFNSEAFGLPTTLPWKLYISPSQRPDEFIQYEYFHPTFLYESILDFVIFILLIVILRKNSHTPGVTACAYLFLYSFVRIFIEAIRVDSALDVGSLHIAQIVSVFLMIVALIFYFLLNKKSPS